jgi:hypothetical protein
MDVCVVFVERTVPWNVKKKWHEGRMDTKTVQKWIKGEKPGIDKKKSSLPANHLMHI